MTTILPDFNDAIFEPGTAIDNPYFPLALGQILAYEAEEEGEVMGIHRRRKKKRQE